MISRGLLRGAPDFNMVKKYSLLFDNEKQTLGK